MSSNISCTKSAHDESFQLFLYLKSISASLLRSIFVQSRTLGWQVWFGSPLGEDAALHPLSWHLSDEKTVIILIFVSLYAIFLCSLAVFKIFSPSLVLRNLIDLTFFWVWQEWSGVAHSHIGEKRMRECAESCFRTSSYSQPWGRWAQRWTRNRGWLEHPVKRVSALGVCYQTEEATRAFRQVTRSPANILIPATYRSSVIFLRTHWFISLRIHKCLTDAYEKPIGRHLEWRRAEGIHKGSKSSLFTLEFCFR